MDELLQGAVEALEAARGSYAAKYGSAPAPDALIALASAHLAAAQALYLALLGSRAAEEFYAVGDEIAGDPDADAKRLPLGRSRAR